MDQQTSEEKAKIAAKNRVCPVCGKELEKDTTALKCSEHGTEPFERKDYGQAKGQ